MVGERGYFVLQNDSSSDLHTKDECESLIDILQDQYGARDVINAKVNYGFLTTGI